MNSVTDIILPSIVALIMLSMGLALTTADFTAVARQPKAFVLGLMSQLLFLPVIGFALASLWPMSPSLAVGLMIIAACPGGPMSNLLTHLARGDTALSISLTTVVSFVTIFSLPIILRFSMAHFMGDDAPPLSLLGTISGLAMMTLIPLSCGLGIRAMAPAFAMAAEPITRRVATVVFFLFILAAIAMEWERVQNDLGAIAPPILILNLGAMSLAYGLARAARLSPPRVVALTLECGIQNGSLAMFVAATLLQDQMMMLPGAAYGLLMFPTAFLFVFVFLQKDRRSALKRIVP